MESLCQQWCAHHPSEEVDAQLTRCTALKDMAIESLRNLASIDPRSLDGAAAQSQPRQAKVEIERLLARSDEMKERIVKLVAAHLNLRSKRPVSLERHPGRPQHQAT